MTTADEIPERFGEAGSASQSQKAEMISDKPEDQMKKASSIDGIPDGGYRVGDVHPQAKSLETKESSGAAEVHRQFCEITEGEAADLGDALVRSLVAELADLHVAGAADAARWALSDAVRQTIVEHHRNVVRRLKQACVSPRRSIAEGQ